MTQPASSQRCVAHVVAGCNGMAQHNHHRKYRSRRGNSDPVNLIPVCWACHDWIHANPREARRRLFSINSWEDPADFPFRPVS